MFSTRQSLYETKSTPPVSHVSPSSKINQQGLTEFTLGFTTDLHINQDVELNRTASVAKVQPQFTTFTPETHGAVYRTDAPPPSLLHLLLWKHSWVIINDNMWSGDSLLSDWTSPGVFGSYWAGFEWITGRLCVLTNMNEHVDRWAWDAEPTADGGTFPHLQFRLNT